MKKERQHIALTISVISAALAGLIALQVYLLFVSYEQKEQAFDRNVMNALTALSQQIEKDEAASKIFNVAMRMPPDGKKKFTRFLRTDSVRPRNAAVQNFTWVISDTIKSERNGQMRVEVIHSAGIDTMTTFVVQGTSAKKQGRQSIGYSYSTNDRGIRINANLNDSALFLLQDTTRRRRGEIVAQVVDKLFLMETLPLEKRIDMTKLDSLIQRSLASVGISMAYNYRIDVEADDSLILVNRRPDGSTIPSTGYKTRLFPNDVISGKYDLVLFLHDRSSFVFKEMLFLFALSLVFITVIAASFAASIRTIIRQKRFAVSIMDFINNMTHEFKTPISTIALASEAIGRQETLKSKAKLLKYNSVIADENMRMKKQVDRILQMAVLEDGELELNRAPVGMHGVISQAVKNVALQVEQKHGTVETALRAANDVIDGDIVHLTNIIHNVLDNANKYSPGIPHISVMTEESGGLLSIVIRDTGIGIDKEHLERVFDKYYRVPTGNTHDVKGFGLGLSYVKMIVEAHGGTVSIASETGKGTSVTIRFPVRPAPHTRE